jgi:hypothetical protein
MSKLGHMNKDPRAPVGEDGTPASHGPPAPPGPPPNRQQLAVLRALAARERNGHLPRVAALPSELVVTYPGLPMSTDFAAMPETETRAKNRLDRLRKRGWVKVLHNGRQRTYVLTYAGREAQRPRVMGLKA